MIDEIDKAVSLVCPIFGVSLGRRNDKETWRIDFRPEATAQQRADAQSAIDAFDIAAYEQAQTTEASRRTEIHDAPLRVDMLDRLKTATLDDISTYVDSNVTDIASARTMFKRILYLIALDARNGG